MKIGWGRQAHALARMLVSCFSSRLQVRHGNWRELMRWSFCRGQFWLELRTDSLTWKDSKQHGREAEHAYFGTHAGELLLLALARAPRGLAVADALQQLPPLLGVQPGRIRVPPVLHWAAPLAAPLTLFHALPPLRTPVKYLKGQMPDLSCPNAQNTPGTGQRHRQF